MAMKMAILLSVWMLFKNKFSLDYSNQMLHIKLDD